MQMNVSEAKARLSELLAAAERGEEVVIARSGHPVARLVPVAVPAGFRIGLADGAAGPLPDFLVPLSEDDRARWG
jgi:prevent-host-death family protein